jgi:hypothetical protein
MGNVTANQRWEPFDKSKHMIDHELKRGLVLRFTDEYSDQARRGKHILIGDLNVNGGCCECCGELRISALRGYLGEEEEASAARGIEVLELSLPDVQWWGAR